MDDSHLKNIYNMLVRTMYFNRDELDIRNNITPDANIFFNQTLAWYYGIDEMRQTLKICMKSLLYIGHEMYLRFYNPAYDDNKLSETLAEIQEKNYY
jgi:hypothetical protein